MISGLEFAYQALVFEVLQLPLQPLTGLVRYYEATQDILYGKAINQTGTFLK